MRKVVAAVCFLLFVTQGPCRGAAAATLAGPTPHTAGSTNDLPALLLVVGAAGEPEFGSNFLTQVEHWTSTAARSTALTISIGLRPPPAPPAPPLASDSDQLKESIAPQARDSAQPLWLVFIGHGTFDGQEARFNLRGPDITASELSECLKPFTRPLVIINTASSSAPFINKLSATNRVILTATRSGSEKNFARFGQYLAEALSNREADLDKDGQTSVLEAFIGASALVAEFYKTEGRLATEHALLDDNGDGLGTPADWFRGIHAVKKPQGAGTVDGARAHQIHLVLSEKEQSLPPEIRIRRDAIELAVGRLREMKAQYSEADYYVKLEKLLAELLDAYGSQLQ